jgi:hypothetical protein
VIVTSCNEGVVLESAVVMNTRYMRLAAPSNCDSDAPLVVKNVDAVPSGPTKLIGPASMPATWNDSACPDATVAVQDNVPQVVPNAPEFTKPEV